MIKKLKHILIAALFLYNAAAFAEENNKLLRHQISVDIANIITFLSKKKESNLINYKWHFDTRNALRSGLDLDWSNGKEGYKTASLRVGYERKLPIVSEHWLFYYGADARMSYWLRNFMPNYYLRWGLSPLAGIAYFLSPRFSVSTELGINFLYTNYRNPENPIPEANRNQFDTNVGYVGMIMLSYHF